MLASHHALDCLCSGCLLGDETLIEINEDGGGRERGTAGETNSRNFDKMKVFFLSPSPLSFQWKPLWGGNQPKSAGESTVTGKRHGSWLRRPALDTGSVYSFLQRSWFCVITTCVEIVLCVPPGHSQWILKNHLWGRLQSPGCSPVTELVSGRAGIWTQVLHLTFPFQL